MKISEENKKMIREIIGYATRISTDCQAFLDTCENNDTDLDNYQLMLGFARYVGYFEGKIYDKKTQLNSLHRYKEKDLEFTEHKGCVTILKRPDVQSVITTNCWRVEIDGVEYDAIIDDYRILYRLREGMNGFVPGDAIECFYKKAPNHNFIYIHNAAYVLERVKIPLMLS